MLSSIRKIIKTNGYIAIGIPSGKKGYLSDSDHKTYYSERSIDNLIESYSFSKVNSFVRPVKSNFLRDRLKAYCYYSIYKKI